MAAEIELIGIDRDAAADAGVLRQRRRGRKYYERRVKTTDLSATDSHNASCIPPAAERLQDPCLQRRLPDLRPDAAYN